MYQKCYKRTLWLVLTLTGFTKMLDGQNVVITTTSTCSNASDGTITLELDSLLLDNYPLPYGGEWENVTDGEYETFYVTSLSHTLSNLTAGYYDIIIALDGQCEIHLNAMVEGIGAPVLALFPTCICPGDYGAASVEVSDGSSTYGYAWSGPGTISNPSIPNPIVYSEGVYAVTVTDSQTGCESIGETAVAPCDVNLPSIIQVTPNCNEAGTSTLSMQLPPGYGLPPFEFKWIKVGFGLVETDTSTTGFASLENAEPGDYCLSLLTMNGCSAQICDIHVTPQPQPQIEYAVTPASNGASNDGAIALTVTGQPGPFTYLWSTGQTFANLSGLNPGNYCVTVTDTGSGCPKKTCISLKDCMGLIQATDSLEAEVTAITFVNGVQVDGSIDILNVQDQFPGYDFNFVWKNEAGDTISTVEDVSGLESGVYYVTVTSDDCPSLYSIGQWEMCNFILHFSQSNTNCYTTTLKVTPFPLGSYLYKWSTGATSQSIVASIGVEYCVTVTLAGECTASACYVPIYKPLNVVLVNLQNATYGNSDGAIEVMAGGGLPPYQYEWSNGLTGASIAGLAPGAYTVTITDGCGKMASATYYIQCEFGQNDMLGVVTNVSCNNTIGGIITLTQLPDVGIPNPVFLFTWSNGDTTQKISNLAAGEYCVTLTEAITGCVAVKCFEVDTSGAADFTVSLDLDPGCFPLSEGSITAIPSNQNLGPFTYAWATWYWGPSPGSLGNAATINNVPAGWYYVTVTDALGCTAANYTLMWPAPPTFTVYFAQQPPYVVCKGQKAQLNLNVFGTYETPLTYQWANYSQNIVLNEPPTGGFAVGNWAVTVTEAGGCQAITLFSVKDGTPEFRSTVDLDCHQGSIQLTILTGGGNNYPPYTYQWSDGATTEDRTGLAEGTYYVTVTNAKGCTATKSFVIVFSNTEVFQGSNVTPSDCDGTCDGSIDIQVSSQAIYNWSNGATTQDISGLCPGNYTVTITSSDCLEAQSFVVDGDGMRTCDVEYEGPSEAYEDSYFWDFPYFRLWAKEVDCFDKDCWLFDPDCSKIWVLPETSTPEDNCWTGTVTITYPDSSKAVFEVIADSPSADDIEWVSGNDEWDPPSAGTYDVSISYIGNGASVGDNCSTTVQANFYGEGNFNDAVGFNDDFWFSGGSFGVPDEFMKAYFGAWKCGVCKAKNTYIYNNDQDQCKDFDNWQFTYFDFIPNDYTAEDPCNSGGWLTIMDFDANGEAIITQVPVLPGSAIASLPGNGVRQPFSINGTVDFFCARSGWCLFNAHDFYANYADPDDKPLLATWADPKSCHQVVWDDPSIPNPDPCSDNKDCPEGLVCQEGNCYQPCQDGECIFGECVEGICVESNECNPDCPEGHDCHEGNCYLDEDICHFSTTVTGGGGESTYNFWHNEPPGTVLTFRYKTYNIPDEFFISGSGLNEHIGCVATGDDDNEAESTFIIGSGNTITVTVKSCGSNSSRFRLWISCESGFQNDPPANLITTHETGVVIVYPNPFVSQFDMVVRNAESGFNGQVMVLDWLGREVISREYLFETGHNRLNIGGLENLTEGMYIVLVRKEGEVYSSGKIVKLE